MEILLYLLWGLAALTTLALPVMATYLAIGLIRDWFRG